MSRIEDYEKIRSLTQSSEHISLLDRSEEDKSSLLDIFVKRDQKDQDYYNWLLASSKDDFHQ